MGLNSEMICYHFPPQDFPRCRRNRAARASVTAVGDLCIACQTSAGRTEVLSDLWVAVEQV